MFSPNKIFHDHPWDNKKIKAVVNIGNIFIKLLWHFHTSQSHYFFAHKS